MNGSADSGNTRPPSFWAPFAQRPFALLWTAALVSNTGAWMHDVGAGWLMTTLDPTPSTVALVQAAATLPVFLFALPAGALADRVSKRSMLVVINMILVLIVSALVLLVLWDRVTPSLLILFTFLIGTCAAFAGPTWQAIVPDLVPRELLRPAIALNSMGINISRAIGPALAGVLITSIGLSAPFVANAATYVVIIGALLIWKAPQQQVRILPAEPFAGAILTGLRHAAFNGPLKATLIRAAGFFVFASAFWSLMPLLARALPGGGAELYGMMLGSVGSGAVTGALSMPALRQMLDTNRMAVLGAVLTAAAILLLAVVPHPLLAIAATFMGGIGWILSLTSFNISAQTALPGWVRARGLSVFLMVFFGSMATGAALWGQVATIWDIDTALIWAAIGLVFATPLTWRAKLGQGEALDLTASLHWPAPAVHSDPHGMLQRGPVLVTVEYRVRPEDRIAFLTSVAQLQQVRRGSGAYQWSVYQDTDDTGRWLECFLVSNWAEHLRQHDRVSHADENIQANVARFHTDEKPPKITHYLAPAWFAKGNI